MKKTYLVLRAEISKNDIIDYHGPFMDIGGYCYAEIPFDKREAFESACRQHMPDTKDNLANIIILESNTNRVCGYYPDGHLFPLVQYYNKADRNYHICCKVTDAIYIPPKARPAFPPSISSPECFFFPPKNAYKELDALISITIDGKTHESLVRYPPNSAYFNKEVEKDYEKIFDEFQNTGDARLISHLLLAAQGSAALEKSGFSAYCVAYAFLHLSMPDKSLEVLEPLLKESPDYVDALLIKGICHMRLNQMKESIETLNKALALYDADDIRYYLGIAYDWSGYHGVAYGMFNSLKEQYWKDFVKDILEDMRAIMPHVTGSVDEVHLPKAYPLPWPFQQRIHAHLDYMGKEKYGCVIRDKGVLATPEEYVRQEFVYHLINDLGYPKEAILVEESLAHIDRDLRERVDVLVISSEAQRRKNLLMVECKAPHVPLDAIVDEQALRYNQILRAKYLILTNLDETQVYYYDNEKYIAKMAIPNYEQLLSDAGIKDAPVYYAPWERPDYKALEDPLLQQHYLGEFLGEGTDKSLRSSILNLTFMLMDDTHKIQCPLIASPFTISKDNGLTTKSVGNPSGGRFRGTYRWFNVQDERKRLYHVYLGIFAAYSTRNQHYENTEGRSMLLVAIDKNSTSISVLEIDLGKHLQPNGSKHDLTHSGIRSKRKIADLMPYIETRAPYLLGKRERIYLGSLDTSKNLLLSDAKTAKVIANTISYALLRFELREMGK